MAEKISRVNWTLEVFILKEEFCSYLVSKMSTENQLILK